MPRRTWAKTRPVMSWSHLIEAPTNRRASTVGDVLRRGWGSARGVSDGWSVDLWFNQAPRSRHDILVVESEHLVGIQHAQQFGLRSTASSLTVADGAPKIRKTSRAARSSGPSLSAISLTSATTLFWPRWLLDVTSSCRRGRLTGFVDAAKVVRVVLCCTTTVVDTRAAGHVHAQG